MRLNRVGGICLICFQYSTSTLGASEIGDALEEEDHEWTVETSAIDSPVQIDLVPENLWHRVLDDSFHGGDALTVIPPTTLPACAKLNATVEGPVRIRFSSKSRLKEAGPNTLLLELSEISGSKVSTTPVVTGEDWSSFEIVCLKSGPLVLSWTFNVFNNPTDQVWLDQVEIHTIRKTDLLLTENHYLVPLGKTISLEIPFVAEDPLEYQWYKDGIPIEGASDSVLFVEPRHEAGSINYVASISGNSYSFQSDPAIVRHVDLRDVLNNTDLQFQIPDQADFDYSDLFLMNEAALDGEASLFLEVKFDEEPKVITSPALLTTEVEGPVLLTYLNTGPLKVEVNDSFPEGSSHVPTDMEGVSRSYIPVFNYGVNQVSWSNNWGYSTNIGLRYTPGKLDRLELTKNPVIIYGPFDQTVYVGLNSINYFDYIAVGSEVRFELLRDGEALTQTANPSSLYRNLELDDDGIFQIRISNELGGTTTSDPFYIEVTSTVEAALNQQHLTWEYNGIPWELQEFDTREGGLAAWVPDDREILGNGILSTIIPGPAKVSFWWKRAGEGSFIFATQNQLIRMAAPADNQWHFEEVLLTDTNNEVSWNGDSGAMLDNITIDYLDQNYFDKWTMSELGEEPSGRPWIEKIFENKDGDGFMNLLEWILSLDTKQRDSPLPWAWVSKGNETFLELEFTRPPITHPYGIFVETSEDMISWSRQNITTRETYDRNIDKYVVSVRDTQPLGKGKRFVRLRVTDGD